MRKSLSDIIKHQNIGDIVDFVVDGSQSDCSLLDDDDEESPPIMDCSSIQSFENQEDDSEDVENVTPMTFKEMVNTLGNEDEVLPLPATPVIPEDQHFEVDDDILLKDLVDPITTTRVLRIHKEKSSKNVIVTNSDQTKTDVIGESIEAGENSLPNNPPEENGNEKAKDTKPKERVYRWRRRKKPEVKSDFNKEFSPISSAEVDLTPDKYFFQFFPHNLITTIVEQTNLYSTQKTGKSIGVDLEEIRIYLGINVMMGIVKLPSYRDYWDLHLRYPPIADLMSRNRFALIRQNFHLVDNTNIDIEDKLCKIRPVLQAVRNECVKIEPEQNHSVDEQIIPSKTRRTKIRQYNPKKPKKWGFKNLVRAGASGFMYDFFIYSGKDESQGDGQYKHLQKCAQIVAKLSEDIPKHEGHKLFFDNWFSTLDLFHYLKSNGILAAGTIRANRIAKCPIESDKNLVTKGRGSFDEVVDYNSGLVVIKWVDNGAVLLSSNFIGSRPLCTISRWDKNKKERNEVDCPAIVKEYNKNMGGVDLADMLIALYRIDCKTKRWYIKVFWHLVDIAKVNGWILYRRHCEQEDIPTKKQLPLKEFSTKIAHALMYSGNKTRGRPLKRRNSNLPDSNTKRGRGKKSQVPIPCDAVRLDRINHWPIPIVDENKKRCRWFGCAEYSRTKCEKCKVTLCLNGSRNCFKDFHELKM